LGCGTSISEWRFGVFNFIWVYACVGCLGCDFNKLYRNMSAPDPEATKQDFVSVFMVVSIFLLISAFHWIFGVWPFPGGS